jgi:hypothetical protein
LPNKSDWKLSLYLINENLHILLLNTVIK